MIGEPARLVLAVVLGSAALAVAPGPAASEASVAEGSAPLLVVVDDATDEGTEGTGTCDGTGTDLDQCVVFEVDLTAAADAAVTVEYTTANGTATASQDFVAQSGTLTFPAGTTDSQFVEVPVVGDTVTEGDETFSLVLSNPQNAGCTGTGADCTGVGGILEGAIPITVDDAAATEGSTTRTVEVDINLATPTGEAVDVRYRTADGTAAAGLDYEPAPADAFVTFNPGEDTKTVSVDVYADSLDEHAETFSVIADGETGETICAANAPGAEDCTGVVTIRDDPADGPPALSVDDPAAVTEGDSGTTTITFTVTLSAPSGKAVTVDGATADGTATGGTECGTGVDYMSRQDTLAFTPGDTTETIDVTLCGDGRDENDETFTVTLSNPQDATLGDATGTGRIADDDAAPFARVFDAEAAEDSGPLVFTVELSEASGKTVTVNVTTENGTAKAPGDYTAKAQTLTFAPGDGSRDFAVALKADRDREEDETFAVTILDATNATVDPDAETAVGTILDDDDQQGYALVDATGEVYPYGIAEHHGSVAGKPLNQPVVDIAHTVAGDGYWLVAEDGGVFSFGGATFHGSMGGKPLNEAMVGLEPTPSGNGYWLVAGDGGVFSFGDATFHGSMGGKPLNEPVVGMAATTTGDGYWLVAAGGGVFAFGDAQFEGSMGSRPLNEPVLDMASTADNRGYWLVARDGGIFTFGGAPFHGSLGGVEVAAVVGMDRTPHGEGYWIADVDGVVHKFGDARALGDAAGEPHAGIVGFGAVYPRTP